MYTLEREQFLPVSKEKAWEFFSAPDNLSRITPPDMEFRILGNAEDAKSMREGQEIEYLVRPLLSIPIRWKSVIRNVRKPEEFTDIQLKGPYSFWEHRHRFTETEGGVIMTDLVRYKLPASFLGRLMHKLFIRKRLEFIFNYRYQALQHLFTS
jgi:ligand-binding SRPBCC domain-containing protein